jgi:hypothetical protein
LLENSKCFQLNKKRKEKKLEKEEEDLPWTWLSPFERTPRPFSFPPFLLSHLQNKAQKNSFYMDLFLYIISHSITFFKRKPYFPVYYTANTTLNDFVFLH